MSEAGASATTFAVSMVIYNSHILPMPSNGKTTDTVSVLPIDTFGGLSGSIAKPKIETFFELTLA